MCEAPARARQHRKKEAECRERWGEKGKSVSSLEVQGEGTDVFQAGK